MITNSHELTNLFQEKNILGKGAEIGVYKGEYSKAILETYLGHLYLVDPWETLDPIEYDDLINLEDRTVNLSQCILNLKNYENRYTIHQNKSFSAATLFEDSSLDFVYIDANHKYDFVKADLNAWYPKVRTGGIIAGHDYIKIDYSDLSILESNGKDKAVYINENHRLGLFGVNPAVDEFCSQHDYSLNKTEEWFASWYFIK